MLPLYWLCIPSATLSAIFSCHNCTIWDCHFCTFWSRHRHCLRSQNAWEQRKLGEIADRILRKNKNNISNLPLTISAQSGLIAQNNFFDKQVASQNLSNYLLLYKGDFAYNKSYSNGYPYGAVKRLEKFNCGVVSSLYIAFKPTHVLPNFLAEYYETTKWYVEIYKRAAEGARNHGLLNISATDFFNSDISLPKRENEQEKIGQLFQSLDKTITCMRKSIAS